MILLFAIVFQQHLKEFFKKQQQQIHNNIQLLQQQSNRKTDEVRTKLSIPEPDFWYQDTAAIHGMEQIMKKYLFL